MLVIQPETTPRIKDAFMVYEQWVRKKKNPDKVSRAAKVRYKSFGLARFFKESMSRISRMFTHKH